jgi:hypothetical protein
MMVSFIVALQPLLLCITRLQILHRNALAQLIDGNDACIFRQAEQFGLLRIDDCFRAAYCDLEGPHLRSLQSEPQS